MTSVKSRSAFSRRTRRVLSIRPDDAVALIWTERSLRKVRQDLQTVGTRATVEPPPRRLPMGSGHYVSIWLRLRRASCLERCMVLQTWLVAHDRPVAVAIGVGNKRDKFAAHAWLPGFDPPDNAEGFTEITRIEA